MVADALTKGSGLPSPAFVGHRPGHIMPGYLPFEVAARLLRCFGGLGWFWALRCDFWLIYLCFFSSPSTLRLGLFLSCVCICLCHFCVYNWLCLRVFTIWYSNIGLHNAASIRSHYCAWGRAIQCPRTRSAAARQVCNARERDLTVTYPKEN